jgi:hypothetical protein
MFSDLFYVVCVNEERNLWQLRESIHLSCLAVGVGKETVFNALYKIVKKYKTEPNFRRELSNMIDRMAEDDRVLLSRPEMEKQNQIFLEAEFNFREEIHDTVHKAIGEVKESDTKLNNKKILSRIKIVREPEVEEIAEEVKPVIKKLNIINKVKKSIPKPLMRIPKLLSI